jgi:hypothetical protein
MTKRANLMLWSGFALVLAAFISYFTVFVRFPATRDVPWMNLLLFAAGLALVGRGVMRAYCRPELYRGKFAGPVVAALSVAIAGFFLAHVLFLSRLPASPGAPTMGGRIPDFTLPDAAGKPVALSSLYGGPDGRWLLLVFYRGWW